MAGDATVFSHPEALVVVCTLLSCAHSALLSSITLCDESHRPGACLDLKAGYLAALGAARTDLFEHVTTTAGLNACERDIRNYRANVSVGPSTLEIRFGSICRPPDEVVADGGAAFYRLEPIGGGRFEIVLRSFGGPDPD